MTFSTIMRFVSSRSFLDRASTRLSEAGTEALFYAALELRLGIEARYHEYLDAASEVTSLKKRGWQVAQLAKDLERVYKTGEKIISFSILNEKDGVPRQRWLYTPISRRARQIAERLGDYLHFTDRFRPWEDGWLTGFRGLVDEGIAQLTSATAGALLAPPLWNAATGQSELLAEIPDGYSFEEVKEALGQPGESIFVRVEYLDTLPT